MKAICEGCLAVVVKGRNTGKDLTVGKFLGKVPDFGYWLYKDMWETDRPLTTINAFNEDSREVYFAPESILMRIDGGGFETEQKAKEKVND